MWHPPPQEEFHYDHRRDTLGIVLELRLQLSESTKQMLYDLILQESQDGNHKLSASLSWDCLSLSPLTAVYFPEEKKKKKKKHL